jgi:hypothetical protein
MRCENDPVDAAHPGRSRPHRPVVSLQTAEREVCGDNFGNPEHDNFGNPEHQKDRSSDGLG